MNNNGKIRIIGLSPQTKRKSKSGTNTLEFVLVEQNADELRPTTATHTRYFIRDTTEPNAPEVPLDTAAIDPLPPGGTGPEENPQTVTLELKSNRDYRMFAVPDIEANYTYTKAFPRIGDHYVQLRVGTIPSEVVNTKKPEKEAAPADPNLVPGVMAFSFAPDATAGGDQGPRVLCGSKISGSVLVKNIGGSSMIATKTHFYISPTIPKCSVAKNGDPNWRSTAVLLKKEGEVPTGSFAAKTSRSIGMLGYFQIPTLFRGQWYFVVEVNAGNQSESDHFDNFNYMKFFLY